MSNRLLRVFWNTDMRGRHEALAAHAKKEANVEVSRLRPGDLLAFVNASRDRLMVLAGVEEKDTYGVLGYYRSPRGRIDEHAIKHVIHAFSGGRLEMKTAIRMALEERLRKRAVHA